MLFVPVQTAGKAVFLCVNRGLFESILARIELKIGILKRFFL